VRNRHNTTGSGNASSSRSHRWAPYLPHRPRPTPPPPSPSASSTSTMQGVTPHPGTMAPHPGTMAPPPGTMAPPPAPATQPGAPPPLAGVPHPAHINSFPPQQISHIANNALYSSTGMHQSSQTAAQYMGGRMRYYLGQYGSRTSEQSRLSTLGGGTPVTGANFEHEHSVGYQPLVRPLPGNRRSAGVRKRAENAAPAYQEVKPAHTEHIGTGGKGSPGDAQRPDRTDLPDKFSDDPDPKKNPALEKWFKEHPERTVPPPSMWGDTRNQYGYRTERYRDDQRTSVMDDRFSDAVQLNQSGYARNQGHRDARGTLDGALSDESYQLHIENMGSVAWAENATTIRHTTPPTAHQRAEMFFSREIANTGLQPTAERRAEVLSYFFDLDNGITPTHRPTIMPGQPQLPYTPSSQD